MIAVAVPVAFAFACTLRRGPSGGDVTTTRGRGYRAAGAVWIGLLAVAVTWELIALFSSPWSFVGWHLFVRGSGAFE
jgi:hypothetical protein